MTTKQAWALRRLMAYHVGTISPADVQAYLDYTDHGRGNGGPLMLAHALMSGAQRNMWLEGHFSGDYPLGCVLQDYLRDALEGGDWERNKPAFEDCYRLHAYIMGHVGYEVAYATRD